MKLSIEGRIWAGFGIALLLLLGLAVSSYRSTRAALENARGLEHSQQVLDHLNNLLLDVVDAEAATRSFVLQESEAALERIRRDDQDKDRLAQDLRAMLVDDAVEQRRLDTLIPSVNQTRGFMASVVETAPEAQARVQEFLDGRGPKVKVE